MSQAKIHIVSQNLWLDLPDFVERHQKLLKTVQDKKSDVVCLQENFGAQTRITIEKALKDGYDLHFSEHFQHSYPILSYFWSILSLLLWNFVYYYLYKNEIILAISIITPFLFSPQVLKLVLIQFWIMPIDLANTEKHRKYDFMALVMGFKKNEFTNIEVLHRKPFKVQGYPFPNFSKGFKNANNIFKRIFLYLDSLSFYYLQITYLRPGLMLTKAKQVKTGKTFLFCNAHLVIADDNYARIRQVLEIKSLANKFSKEHGCEHVIVCGDFNSQWNFNTRNPPEIQFLKEHQFQDMIGQLDEYKKSPENFDTWDNKNKYTHYQKHDERDNRIDYIFYADFDGTNIVKNQKKPDLAQNICNTPENLVSDHYGLEGIINF